MAEDKAEDKAGVGALVEIPGDAARAALVTGEVAVVARARDANATSPCGAWLVGARGCWPCEAS